MKPKSQKLLSRIFLILFFLVIFSALFLTAYFLLAIRNQLNESNDDYFSKNYHIMVLGNYENELFMKQVYEGAKKLEDDYKAVVELYVPESFAEDVSTQGLFDYATFVNADGIIVYINSLDDVVEQPHRIDNTNIPVVTTGQFVPSINQISYIGTNYRTLGHTIGQEILNSLKDGGTVYIQESSNATNINYSNLSDSILSTIRKNEAISFYIVNDFSQIEFADDNSSKLLLCLTEEDTIHSAQIISELNLNKKRNLEIIGFGSNEISQLYLSKGIIKELISPDPEKIGETAMRELFEYRNKGYANSYIAADVIITRRENEN